MIVDSLRGFERYISFHPRFAKAYEFLTKNNPGNMEPGEYPVMGKEIYCTIWEGNGKGLEFPPLEVHDSYIDIHLLIEGNETIGIKDRAKCSADNVPYDQEKDIAFIDEIPENFINMSPGNIAIIFPHDAHSPLIGEGHIKKMVIKVLV
ncbi:MAG: YhcH/YjgK/YiaL family protein [Bacteroidales bacterium]|nr:YhcH/YjgK/YiaL family protein [Bacteroidales bacterium]MDD3300304.1 YhcH/YjgK/YiaL family protein [Bacteroidales bacterium]MDD3844013.1 YhcH/YjgK/YiaL family protein [Bacteroidales bacterium]